MSALPDRAMMDVASQIIDFLGDIMAFQRRIGDVWEERISDITVYLQPRESSYRRSFRGMEDTIDFVGFTAAEADIMKGDRTVINNTYYVIDVIENRGTHIEFRLRQTDEIPDA